MEHQQSARSKLIVTEVWRLSCELVNILHCAKNEISWPLSTIIGSILLVMFWEFIFFNISNLKFILIASLKFDVFWVVFPVPCWPLFCWLLSFSFLRYHCESIILCCFSWDFSWPKLTQDQIIFPNEAVFEKVPLLYCQ